MQLFDFQMSAFGQALFQLGQGEFQNAVHILGLDLVGIYAGDVKASLVGAVGALHTDDFVLLVLFLDFGSALGTDNQSGVDYEVFCMEDDFDVAKVCRRE